VIKAEGGIKIMDEMLNDGGSIYVHCSAGIYRSPQIISLYLTMYQRYTVEEAVNFVKSRHPYAKPSWKVVDASLRLIKLKKYLKKISI
jgi:protein-tyrosine phosphatase